jgi:hypothetical protein
VRKTVLLIGLAGALAAAPVIANAQPGYGSRDCYSKRVTGTVLGGLGGGAIGAAAAAGVAVTPWAWAAAGVGALIGHAIGVSACHNDWRGAYYDDRWGYPPPPPRPYAYYGRGYYDAGYGYYQRPAPPPPPRYYYGAQYDNGGYGYQPAPPPPPQRQPYYEGGYEDAQPYEAPEPRYPRG